MMGTDSQDGRRLRNLAQSADDDLHITPGNDFDATADTELHRNSFGFESKQQSDLFPGHLDTMIFKSGPELIVSTTSTSDYFEQATLSGCDDNGCDNTGCGTSNNAGMFGLFSSYTDQGDNVYMNIKCDGENGAEQTSLYGDETKAYCENLPGKGDDRLRMDVDPTKFCLTSVENVIDHFLCHKQQTVDAQVQRWDYENVDSSEYYSGGHDSTYNLCDIAEFSTDKKSLVDADVVADHSQFNKQLFSASDIDQLDQQCFIPDGALGKEFNEVVCVNANHLNEHGQNQDAGFSATGLQGLLNTWAAAEDANNAELKNDIASRYPQQDYCLALKDRTLFKELFGCADDQRIPCEDGGPIQCAGGIDKNQISSHVEYLPPEWYDATSGELTGLLGKGYGNNAKDFKYHCSEAEISVANELSAYLDKVDIDITKACEVAVDTFEKTSKAYIKFVTPETEVDGVNVVSPLYAVLKAAWEQAEFTLRSMKLQEQVRDRMLKYRDWTMWRFSTLQGSPTKDASRADINAIRPQIMPPSLKDNTDYTDASTAYQTFAVAWDEHIEQYEALSLAEYKELLKDMETIKGEIEKAKAHARELADTQKASSAAVATVSVHFRKKLQLWVKIENMLEDAFNQALAAEEALHDQRHRNHVYSNYARVDSPREEYTPTFTSNDPKMTDGKDYSLSNGGYSRHNEADLVTQSDYPSDYSNDSDNPDPANGYNYNKDNGYESKFEASNGDIATNLACNVGGNECDIFGYTSAAASGVTVHNRASECVSGHCVIKSTTHFGADNNGGGIEQGTFTHHSKIGSGGTGANSDIVIGSSEDAVPEASEDAAPEASEDDCAANDEAACIAFWTGVTEDIISTTPDWIAPACGPELKGDGTDDINCVSTDPFDCGMYNVLLIKAFEVDTEDYTHIGNCNADPRCTFASGNCKAVEDAASEDDCPANDEAACIEFWNGVTAESISAPDWVAPACGPVPIYDENGDPQGTTQCISTDPFECRTYDVLITNALDNDPNDFSLMGICIADSRCEEITDETTLMVHCENKSV